MSLTSGISAMVHNVYLSVGRCGQADNHMGQSAASFIGRERRIFWLFIGVWIVNAFDLGFTQLAFEQGLLEELNPLACHLLPHGLGVLLIYKFVLLGAGTLILWHYRRYPLAEAALWFYALFCVFLSVQWHLFFIEVNPSWLQFQWCQGVLPHGRFPAFEFSS